VTDGVGERALCDLVYFDAWPVRHSSSWFISCSAAAAAAGV